MATLLLRDSITAADIPLDGLAAVAGYGDGPWMWTSKDWKRFDDAKILALSVVIDPAHQGDILDVERADAEPIQVPGWIRRFDRPHRRKPTIYCNRSTWKRQPGSPAITVTEALATAGFPITAVDWWAATLDGTTDGTDGAVAVQWKGAEQTGGHYDESIILDPAWVGQPGANGDEPMTDEEIAAQWRYRFHDTYHRAPSLLPDGTYEDTYWMLHQRQVGATSAVIDWVTTAEGASDYIWNIVLQDHETLALLPKGGDGSTFVLPAGLVAIEDAIEHFKSG